MNTVKRSWIAMFSHSGQEIMDISKKLGRCPDKIITNNRPGHSVIDTRIREIFYSRWKPEAVEYHRLFARGLPLVTMHGWMRIVPKRICDEYDIYNLHPGDIVKYPELKGKDPQKKVFRGEYPTIGCVLHKAIGEVDSGDIISRRWCRNKFETLDDMNKKLRQLSVEMWCKFLEEELDKEILLD